MEGNDLKNLSRTIKCIRKKERGEGGGQGILWKIEHKEHRF